MQGLAQDQAPDRTGYTRETRSAAPLIGTTKANGGELDVVGKFRIQMSGIVDRHKALSSIMAALKPEAAAVALAIASQGPEGERGRDSNPLRREA